MRTKQIISAILATLLVSVTVGCGSATPATGMVEDSLGVGGFVPSLNDVFDPPTIPEIKTTVSVKSCLENLQQRLKEEKGLAISYNLYLKSEDLDTDLLICVANMQMDRNTLRCHSNLVTPLYDADAWYSTECTDAYMAISYYPEEKDLPWTFISHDSEVYEALMSEADYSYIYPKALAAVTQAFESCNNDETCPYDVWTTFADFDSHKIKVTRNHDIYKITMYISETSYSVYEIEFRDVNNTVPEIVLEAPGSLADIYLVYYAIKEN